MTKTCYFCENEVKCHGGRSCSHVPVVPYNCELETFTPNADWLEYEGLLQRIIELEIGEKLMEKEYESLKKENEELKLKLNPVQKIFQVGDVVTECDWAHGKTEDGKTYHFQMNNGQSSLSKSSLNAFVITEI